MDINIYSIILFAAVALIFVWRMSRSYKTGFVSELANAISILIAIVIGFLIRNIVISYIAAKYGRILAYLTVIAIVLLIYKLLKLIFGAMKLFASLPVIKVVNRLLGILLGAAEAFVIVLFVIKLIKELLEI